MKRIIAFIALMSVLFIPETAAEAEPNLTEAVCVSGEVLLKENMSTDTYHLLAFSEKVR